MKKLLYYLPVLVLLLTACTKNAANDYKAKAVVEAYLQPGQKVLVKITREILAGESGTGSLFINSLSVVIVHNGTSYALSQNADSVYENTTMPVIEGDSYELSFSYNNVNVTATAVVPSKPANFSCSPLSITVPTFSGGIGGGTPTIPDPLKAKWDNTNEGYHLLAIKSVDPNATEISNNGFGGQATGFSNAPDQSNNKEINFRAFEYYGKNALILYHIQPELAALYNTGNSNSQNLSTVPTNVNNGLGIFTAVNIADSVFVTVN